MLVNVAKEFTIFYHIKRERAHITHTVCKILQTVHAPVRYTRVRIMWYVLNSHRLNYC